MTSVDSYDVSVPSAGIHHCTLTRTPNSQWINDFGPDGVLRLSYFGMNVSGIQRWNLRMTKESDSWLVGKSDVDGRWLDNAGNQVEVDITPTIWNLLKRVALLEDNCCANVNAAIVCMKETRADLSQQVAQAVSNVQSQQRTHSETVARLLMTHHHEHLDQATKLKDCEGSISGIHKAIAEIAEGVRLLKEDLANNVYVGVSDTNFEELVKDLTALREKVHYACVKHEEPDRDINDAFAQIEILKNTVGTCLLRHEEVQQTLDRATKDVSLLQREFGTLNSARLLPVNVIDLSEQLKNDLEPGEALQCTCKRRRR